MRPPDRTFPNLSPNGPAAYEIVVQGCVDERWSDWFDGMSIARERSSDGAPLTVLTGSVADHAALLGMLRTLYTLGFPLCSVLCIGTSAWIDVECRGRGPRSGETQVAQATSTEEELDVHI